MPQLKLWRFALRFGVLYGLLVFPWPGSHQTIASYIQGFGSVVFGQSGRAFIAKLATTPKGEIPAIGHHVILFRPKGPSDMGYSKTTDTMILLYNFDILDKNRIGGSLIGLESKQLFWLPFAFYLALMGATPMPWRRRATALLWGILTAHILLAVTLSAYIAGHASDISLIMLSPFWKAVVQRLTMLLVVVSGPSILIYLFVWPFACFRREELIRIIPHWRDWTAQATVAKFSTRQQRRAQFRADLKKSFPARNISKYTSEKPA